MKNRPTRRVRRQLADTDLDSILRAIPDGLPLGLENTLEKLRGYALGLPGYTSKKFAALVPRMLEECVALVYDSPHPEARRWLQARWRTIGSSDMDLVLRAAEARWLVDHALTIDLPALEALSGISIGTLRNYGARGVLEITDGRVTTKSARAWLATKGL